MKKLMTSTIILLPILLLAILLVSGAIMSMVTHIYVESVEFVDEKPIVLVMSDETDPPTYDLSPDITVLPLKAKNRDLKYETDDESLITVDEKGVVKAVYYGETYVTVASKENKAISAKRKVIVTDREVHKIVMKEYNAEMYKGETARLLYEVFPAEANSAVIWTSSAPDVLSVTPSGDITCLGKGEVTITAASVEKPEITATATIVCHIPLGDLTAEVSSVTTAEKEADFPKLTVSPANATYTLQYTTSDQNIATVDENGHITVHNAGEVVITATATDGRENTHSASVTYHCTNGYYMGPLFGEKSSFTFDYDQWAGKTLDPIVFTKTPANSYRQIVDVVISDPELISFNDKTEQFTLNEVADDKPLGTVTVTIKARKFNFTTGTLEEFEDDKCEIAFTRNVSALSFISGGEAVGELDIKKDSINLSNPEAGNIGVVATPANHTNNISFAITEGETIAHIDGSALIFDAAGTAVVTVTAKDAQGNVQKTASLTVTYTEPVDEAIEFEVTPESVDADLVLDVHSNGAMKKLLLTGSTPEGMTRVVTVNEEGKDVVAIEDGYIVPKKGGFATVTISYEPVGSVTARRAAPQPISTVCTIHIYVDMAISTQNIVVDKNGFTTSKESIAYVLTLNVTEDFMEGKQLFVDDKAVSFEVEEGGLVYRGTKDFGSENEIELNAVVKYGDEVQKFGKTGEVCDATATFQTTHGKLTKAPAVTYGEEDTAIAQGEEKQTTISFSDLGERVVITVDAHDPEPTDFVLTEGDITLNKNQNFTYEKAVEEGNIAKLTLTATVGGAEDITLTVAGMVYRIHLDISSLADTITVQYGSKTLDEETTYNTFLDELTFTVKISRKTGEEITDKSLTWGLKGEETETVEGTTTFTLENVSIPEAGTEIALTSGKASFTLHIEKTTLAAQEFHYHIEYHVNGKDSVETYDSFTVGPASEPIEYAFPKTMNGVFSICIEEFLTEENLGGVTDDLLNEFFKVTSVEDGMDWGEPTVNASTKKIDITLPYDRQYFVDEKLTFTCGEHSIDLILTRNNIERISFTGFDSENKTNGGDVYKGYQQVRVFAKHSDYDGKGSVDYFKVPLVVLSDIITDTHADDLSLLSWTFNGYKGNDKTDFTATQRGMKVTYGGNDYNIVKVGEQYVLQTAEGASVVGVDGKYADGQPLVPWVDVYSEPYSEETGVGYARIYFGGFTGLSETDVQNDLFGNFDEKETWEQPGTVYDITGTKVEPADGSFTFLRIEANNSAKGGANAHFNFNVLADDTLVNVFNASGYYKHDNLVLHENLYGPGENPDAPAEQVLNSSSNINKTLIYGNGNQVNFEQRNAELVKVGDKGTSQGVNLQKSINATIKGSTPTETVKKYEHVVVLKMQYAYYCDVEYYSKISPWGASGNTPGYIYLKNTVLRCAAQSALQLYYSTSTAYIENVVLNECVGGFVSDSQDGRYDVVYNFKGFVDVLNYMSFSGLASSINQQIGMMAELGFDAEIKNNEQYLEWFGKTPDAITSISSGSEPWLTRRFFNVFLYNRFTSSQGSTLTIKFWDQDAQQYRTKEEGGAFDNGVGLATPIDQEAVMMGFIKMGYYRVFVYDTSVALDGGQKIEGSQYYNDRNMKQLFSEDRYIRLLCQYKTLDGETPVKNFEHILWHTNQIYRDLSLAGQTERHIENLKNSLKDVQWPDGTTPADADPSLALARMLSETVLPGKDD